ncbi:MAG: AMP-binding protein, partial [Planctomycetota bacterium]
AGAVTIALLGQIVSLGVPKRPAAAPKTPFPWRGPLDTFRQFVDIRRDRLLTLVVVANVTAWFAGSLLIQLINLLATHQLGTAADTDIASYMVASQLVGLAIGGLIGSRLAHGRPWYRLLPAGMFIMGAVLGLVALLPQLDPSWQRPAAYWMLGLIGVIGGMILIPCEGFVQVRAAGDRKGAVIASVNFAVFTGILISGPVANWLFRLFRPTSGMALVGAMLLPVGVWLWLKQPGGSRGAEPVNDLLMLIGRMLLALRYRVRVRGINRIARKGPGGILFLPNHPGVIDPVILVAHLYGRFRVRALADRDQIDRFFIRSVAWRIGVMPIPDVAKAGPGAAEAIRHVVAECVETLRRGENVLLYPSGRTYRSHLEQVGGTSAVETVLRELPDVRVVLVRTRGIWGSRFTWAWGGPPDVAGTMWRGAGYLLASGILFAPKRPVDIELVEPEDFPRRADRATINRYLERFYNVDAPPNTYVPYTMWERSGLRELPDPPRPHVEGDPSRVPEATRRIVREHLEELTGVRDFDDGSGLARDLGMDSLMGAELVAWLQSEFGFTADPESLRTVADAMLAACGESVSIGPVSLEPVPRKWFARAARPRRPEGLAGMTVPQAFLAAADVNPDAVVAADQASGAKTYRDIVAAVAALGGPIGRLPGERIGVMMPASVGAGTLYLATLLAGRTPVMVNWTLGPGNLRHCLDSAGVRRILTSRRLLTRLRSQGVDLGSVKERFVSVEDIASVLHPAAKLSSWLRARLSWTALHRAAERAPETAVVLFTSGSESVPKAVPLTHRNLLTNVSDVWDCFHVGAADSMLGILPPFHAFGLTVTVLLPLCLGVRVVYYPNPTDGVALGRMIEAYKVTLLGGTPTFLHGIVRASTPEQLATLRLVVSGAERCPQRVYDALAKRCPQTVVMEGYGVTECSPIISVNRESDPRPGTIGRIIGSFEHALVDPESGERVRRGAEGMLLVRGPSVFGGYLNYDGPSPFVEFEGRRWYRTGDLVSRTYDGVLTFAGRLKRFVKLGGEMISLPAIEAVLEEHYRTDADDGPVMAVVAAAGGDDHSEIVLFTVKAATRAEVNARIRQAGLSGLHNVRRVIRVDALPLLGTGKTDYR